MAEEHSIIMNHSQILPPEDSLPTMMPETPAQKVSQQLHGVDVKNRIKSLGKRGVNFWRTGKVELEYVDEDGNPQVGEIHIRSIPMRIMREISGEYNDCISRMPRVWSEERKTWEQDMSDPESAQLMSRLVQLQGELTLDKFLYGTMLEFYDEDEQLVWGPTKRDSDQRDAAIEAINRSGLTLEDINKVVAAIDELVATDEEETKEEFEKKSTPP